MWKYMYVLMFGLPIAIDITAPIILCKSCYEMWSIHWLLLNSYMTYLQAAPSHTNQIDWNDIWPRRSSPPTHPPPNPVPTQRGVGQCWPIYQHTNHFPTCCPGQRLNFLWTPSPFDLLPGRASWILMRFRYVVPESYMCTCLLSTQQKLFFEEHYIIYILHTNYCIPTDELQIHYAIIETIDYCIFLPDRCIIFHWL